MATVRCNSLRLWRGALVDFGDWNSHGMTTKTSKIDLVLCPDYLTSKAYET